MSDKLWGGRFGSDITDDVLDYTLTVDIDERLVSADIWQNVAHVLMLGRQKIIPQDIARGLLGSLLQLWEREKLVLRPEFEDVHLNIEQMVVDDLGRSVGGHLHTARSRNDQVATDTRIYLRNVSVLALSANLDLVTELLTFPDSAYQEIIPGYTHGQAAQPVSVAFWRTAHASMLLRDVGRLRDSVTRTNESPLGACALAGTSFPVDRSVTARLLGFPVTLSHALDASSARDHMIELASAFAIGATSLSRMAEEIVIWSSNEYRLCEVADEFATGSSIMPQKKNPVVAELVRARTGRALGTLVQLLTAVKGVPLGYSCDLQEDKPYLWAAIDSYLATVRIMVDQVRGLRFDPVRGRQLCWDNFSTATELANYFVGERGVPFREAHRTCGAVVADLLGRGRTLRDLDGVRAALARLGHEVDRAVLAQVLDPATAVEGYTSEGGTAPASVHAVRGELEDTVAELRGWVEALAERSRAAQQATFDAARRVVEGMELGTTLDAVLLELAATPTPD